MLKRMKIWVSVVVALGIGASGLWAQEEPSKESGRFSRGSSARATAEKYPTMRPPTFVSPPGATPASRPVPTPSTVAPQPTVSIPVAARAEPIPVLKEEAGKPKPKMVVYSLRSVPAMDLANTLDRVYRAQPIRAAAPDTMAITPDPISNSLIVTGPPEAVEEVGKLIENLDQRAAMVQLEVLIAEAPANEVKAIKGKPEEAEAKSKELRRIEKPEQMQVLSRVRLTTLDNQEANIRIGRSEPAIHGTTLTQFGQTNSIQYHEVGTIIRVTPRVMPNNTVTMALSVEHSQAGKAEEGVPLSVNKQGETIRAPNIEQLATKTNVSIADGETLFLSAQPQGAKSPREFLIVITPRVMRVGETK